MLKHFGGIDGPLRATASELARVDGIGLATAERIVASRDHVDVDGEVEAARTRGVRIISLLDREYPPALKTIADPPPCLYVRGSIEPADAVALAIVGARQCSRYGAEQAERFGALACRAGLTVVSGLARGVDSYAHKGALAAEGRTLAVLGCGLNHLYPPDASELAERVVQRGALLSELAMDVPPDEKNFPRRNRIIAGLALGTLVIEATARSGAMISARLANDYNREVFAVPGRLDTPQADGCNLLIQRGEAKLVIGMGDILAELGEAGKSLMQVEESATAPPESKLGPRKRRSTDTLDDTQRTIVGAFDGEPMSIDALAEATGISPARIAASLTTLQLTGWVKRAGDCFDLVVEPRS